MDYVNWKPDPSPAPAIVPVRHSTPPRVVPEQLPMKLQAQVQKYQAWLHVQAKRKEPVQERQDYTKLAQPPVLLNGQAMTTYAPYRPTHSAYQTFTTPQFLMFALLVMVAMLLEFFFGYEFLTGCIEVITALYITQLIITAILLGKASQMTVVEQISSEIITALDKRNVTWPLYTILCPLYKEAAIVPQFLIAMNKLDYPKERLQILLLVEESDKQTQRAIQQLAPPSHFQVVIVPDGQPRTKPRACNYGLMQATGQYVVIYDAEDIPDPLQLKKAVLTFANHGSKLACVQAQLNFYNASQNLLTRLFTIEYTMWFDIMLPALWRGKLSLPLGGTSNHFQTTILRGLGGWDAFNVTEDCDLGMRLTQYNLKTAIVESTTYEEANSQFGNWVRQRSRWIKGYMQTYLVYMRNPREMFTRKRDVYEKEDQDVLLPPACGRSCFVCLLPQSCDVATHPYIHPGSCTGRQSLSHIVPRTSALRWDDLPDLWQLLLPLYSHDCVYEATAVQSGTLLYPASSLLAHNECGCNKGLLAIAYQASLLGKDSAWFPLEIILIRILW